MKNKNKRTRPQKVKLVQAWVTAATHERLLQRAEAQEASMATVLRQILAKDLAGAKAKRRR